MGILIDTDVLIEYLRGSEEIIQRFIEEYRQGKRLCFSPITTAEIVAGIRKGEEGITSKLFTIMECLKIDDRIGHKAGEYINKFKASHNVELADALIAATAHHAGIVLWTLNKKHYPMKDVEFFV